jgi:alpha-D-xyloside xylohydrolase
VREQHGFHTLPLLACPDSVISVIPFAADDQHPVSAWADGVELRVHAFADGAEHTLVIPRADGPGETARFHLRRDGDRLWVTTDSPQPLVAPVRRTGRNPPHQPRRHAGS